MPKFGVPRRAAALAVGIDASLTSTGLVVLDLTDGQVLRATAIRPQGSGVSRLAAIQDALKAEMAAWAGHPLHIAMERYGYDSFGRNSEIGEGGGAIKLALYRTLVGRARYPTLVAPNQLKKFVAGVGSGKRAPKKEDMKLEVFKRWGYEYSGPGSNDVIDAYGLARIAQMLMSPVEMPVFQADVIAALIPYTEMPELDRYEAAIGF